MRFWRERLDATPQFEIESRPAQLEYAAVPLDPWNVCYPGEAPKNYVEGSLDHIDDKVQEAVAEAVTQGRISRDFAAEVKEFMKQSLYESQMYRIDLNTKDWSREILDETDERVQRAFAGTATPDELLSILADCPELGSIELAKLSHPLKPEDSLPMSADVEALLLTRGAAILDEPAYYKGKLKDPEIPARVLLRKQPIADYMTEHGVIRVMRRESLVVHGKDETNEDVYFNRMIKNPERLGELIEKVDGAYDYLGVIPIKWLHPLATTYYAKYL